jgi:hypothetical protein
MFREVVKDWISNAILFFNLARLLREKNFRPAPCEYRSRKTPRSNGATAHECARRGIADAYQ